MRIETVAVHAAFSVDPSTGAVAPPLHLSTTFGRDEAGIPLSPHTYVRESNPTQDLLEEALARLEGGEAALVFGSGMAAGLAEVGRELKTGRGFAKPMMETRRFPAFAVHMIQVGEETGLRVQAEKIAYIEELIDEGHYVCKAWVVCRLVSGALSTAGRDVDEGYLQGAEFFSKAEVQNMVVYPTILKDTFWRDLEAGFPEIRYLGYTGQAIPPGLDPLG